MIDKSKTYRTRDGREVRIYATDGAGSCAIHGAIKTSEGWVFMTWFNNGKWSQNSQEDNTDLIEVRPRHKRTVWLNVYSGVTPSVWCERNWADRYAEPNRLACIKVELDFEEGEGL